MLGEYQELENEEISVCETNYSNYTGLCDYMFVSRYGQNYSMKAVSVKRCIRSTRPFLG